MAEQQKGFIIVVIASLGLGTIGLWSRLAYNAAITPLELLTMRFTLAAVLLWVYALMRHRKELRIGFNNLFRLFIQGGIAYAVTSIGYFYALKYLPVSLTAILFYLHPVYTIILSRLFLKEKISGQRWGALLMTFVGILLLVGYLNSNTGYSITGIILIVLSGLSYAGFAIFNQRLKADCNGYVSTLYTITFCALIMNAITRPSLSLWLSLNTTQWLIVLGIALLGTIVGIYGLVAGIRLVGASAASIYSAIEPLAATVLALAFLREQFSVFQALGMLLVLAGVSIIKIEQKANTINSIQRLKHKF